MGLRRLFRDLQGSPNRHAKAIARPVPLLPEGHDPPGDRLHRDGPEPGRSASAGGKTLSGRRRAGRSAAGRQWAGSQDAGPATAIGNRQATAASRPSRSPWTNCPSCCGQPRESGNRLPRAVLRTVPSAGNRHALETYLAVLRVCGLAPGMYRYLPLEHQLLHLFPEEQMARELTEATLGQSLRRPGGGGLHLDHHPLPHGMALRPAAHKVIALDAGHVCQNLYLACEAIGAGTCAVAAYHQQSSWTAWCGSTARRSSSFTWRRWARSPDEPTLYDNHFAFPGPPHDTNRDSISGRRRAGRHPSRRRIPCRPQRQRRQPGHAGGPVPHHPARRRPGAAGRCHHRPCRRLPRAHQPAARRQIRRQAHRLSGRARREGRDQGLGSRQELGARSRTMSGK